MRLTPEEKRSTTDAEHLAQPLPYELHLSALLNEAFRSDYAAQLADWQTERLLPSLVHAYTAYDGSTLEVRPSNWQLSHPRGADGRRSGAWNLEIRADADGVVRPRYVITTEKHADRFEVGSDGIITAPTDEKIQHTYDVVVDGDRAHIYEHPEPGSGEPPVPVDPAVAEHLVTLLQTSTPLSA